MKRGRFDPILTAEVAAFLYYEARLLDEGRFAEWLELLADDILYYAPSRELVQGGSSTADPNALAFDLFRDDKASLKMRVDRVLTGLALTDLPPSATQHLIGNVEAERDGDVIVARSKFAVMQARPGRHEGHEAVFFGDRVDRLRPHGDSWLIAARRLNIVHSVLPRAVSIIF